MLSDNNGSLLVFFFPSAGCRSADRSATVHWQCHAVCRFAAAGPHRRRLLTQKNGRLSGVTGLSVVAIKMATMETMATFMVSRRIKITFIVSIIPMGNGQKTCQQTLPTPELASTHISLEERGGGEARDDNGTNNNTNASTNNSNNTHPQLPPSRRSP